MIGDARESVWLRGDPRRTLAPETLARILEAALPGSCATEIEAFPEGRRNANFKLRISTSAVPLVLRLYEHNPSICQKEVDLLGLVREQAPVPEVVYAAPAGLDEVPPFVLYEYIEGITFRELKRLGGADALAEAAFSAGQALAAIGAREFEKAGWLGPGPAVGAPLLEGADPMPRFLDLCLANPRSQERLEESLRARIHDFAWRHAAEYAVLEREHRLVHCDYNRRNVLVRLINGKWGVAAILDWEFAVSATPLIDMGNFLRYESAACPKVEPHFSAGYVDAGGKLPEDWRAVSRLVDLTAICEGLTGRFIPDDAVAELVEIARATVA